MADESIGSEKSETPWPSKGDCLFQSADDWWYNACLNYSHDDFLLYVTGYKVAGEVLAQHAADNTRMHLDALVYPIVFVNRQYLELCLKMLIRNCRIFFGIRDEFPKTHDLLALWAECKKLLTKFESRPEEDVLEAVEDGIRQFCQVDPRSEGFRYPVNKSGCKSLPPDVTHINIRNLAEIMEKISNFFDSACVMVDYHLDLQQDAQDSSAFWC